MRGLGTLGASVAAGLLLGLFVAPSTGSAQVALETRPNVLRVSTQPDRTGAALLAGSVVGARIYVTLANPSGVASTRFFVDDPLRTGKPVGADVAKPYDARGGTTSAARPLPTYGLVDGKHTLTVEMRLRSGGIAVKTARFTVRNTLTAPALTVTTGNARAELRWSATVRPSLAGFKVFRALPGGRFVAVTGLLGVSARSWSQTGLVNGTRYGYIVQAVGTISRLTAASPARYGVPLPPLRPHRPASRHTPRRPASR